MDREQQSIAKRERANRAKALLENEMLRSAFDETRSSLQKSWSNTSPEQADERERIWQLLFALNHVEHILENHIKTGILAEKELEAIVANKQTRRRRVF